MSNSPPVIEFYPSTKLRLIIRFEEFADTAVTKTVTAKVKKPPQRLRGVVDKNAPNTVVEDSLDGVSRFLVKPTIGNKTAHKAGTSEDGYTHVIGGIIPQSCTLGLNGTRTADTLQAMLAYVDLPFDPRVIRSCALEYYHGTVTPEDFARGVAGGVRTNGEPMNMVRDTFTDADGNERSNLRFSGWVDKWSIKWSDKDPIVSLDCRDNTALFIEQEAPPKLVISMKMPITKAIATYLSNFTQFGGITVEYRPQGETEPTIGDGLSKTAFRPQLGPPPAKGGGASTGSKLTVWDYFTDVCSSIGHIIRLEGTCLIIQRVRTATSSSTPARHDDPFKPRDTESGTAERRRFIYGRNVLEMEVSRSFAKTAPTNVEVRCYNPARKSTLVAHFPISTQKVASKQPGDAAPEVKFATFRVSGIKDIKILRLVAQSLYEQIGRNELSVGLKTRNMASFGGGNADPDILDMRATDTFDLFVNRSEEEFDSMTKIETLLLARSRAVEFLKLLGYEGPLADAYAKAYSDAGFQTAFRVKAIAFHWSIGDGVSIDIVGFNYIEIRMDRVLPEGEEVKP